MTGQAAGAPAKQPPTAGKASAKPPGAALAYTLAAGILFLIANAFPIVGLDLQGQSTAATLFGTTQALYQQNMTMLAALVFFTTILVPAVQLSAMTYLLLPLRLGRVPLRLPLALRVLQAVRPWGMPFGCSPAQASPTSWSLARVFTPVRPGPVMVTQ